MDMQKILDIADRADRGMGVYIDADEFDREEPDSTVLLDGRFALTDLKELV